jgi:hypothetical protein
VNRYLQPLAAFTVDVRHYLRLRHECT